jgi:hypothetical protein
MARTLAAPTVAFSALLLASALAAEPPPFRSGVEAKQRLDKAAGTWLPEDRDGKRHRIEVRVPTRSDVTVRARSECAAPVMTTTARPAGAEAPTPQGTTSDARPSAGAEAPAPHEAIAAPHEAAPAPHKTIPAPHETAPALQLRPTSDPAVEAIVRNMAEYVSGYGASAALFVLAERYDQRVELGPGQLRPHSLESEFAIVRTRDTLGWAGYRDVVEADGEQVVDRRDRLQALLTGTADPRAEVKRIADESARYNVGPVMRNFNLPTTTLFFFHPSRLGRFSFKARGMKKVDGTPVQQLDFTEIARPTLVMKRDGTDVPVEGSVWVVPEDGTIVRTRVRLRGFADSVHMGTSSDPGSAAARVAAAGEYASPPPVQVASPTPPPSTGGSGSGSGSGSTAPPSGTGSASGTGQGSSGQAGGTVAQPSPQATAPAPMAAPSFPSMQRIDSRADVEVTYRRDPRFGVWLPAKMSEIYEGPIQRGTSAPLVGRATAVAQYSDYRRFETSATLVAPK